MTSTSTEPIAATAAPAGPNTGFLAWQVQLPLFFAHVVFCLISLGVAVSPSDDDAFYAVSAWNLPNRGGTGNASFGTLNGTDQYIATYPAGGALWIATFLYSLGPNYFAARLASFVAALLAALVSIRLYSRVVSRNLPLGSQLFIGNVYLSLPIVTLTSNVCRLDQLMTAMFYAPWLLVMRGLDRGDQRPLALAGLMTGAAMLVHFNAMFAVPTAFALIALWPNVELRRRAISAFTFAGGSAVGAAIFSAIHILPRADQFSTQWQDVIHLGLGPPLQRHSLISCASMEWERWVGFYWGYPYKRFLMEPIAVLIGLVAMTRRSRTSAAILALIGITIVVSLAAAAGNKWPWYIAYCGPIVAVVLTYPFLEHDPRRIVPWVVKGMAAVAIAMGLFNHVGWFHKAAAWNAASHYARYRAAVGPHDRMFVRGADTYAFIDADRRVLSHWYFENYEGRSRNRKGERRSFLSYMEDQDVNLLLLNDNLRDFLIAQNEKSEAARTYTGLDELLELLGPFAPLDKAHGTFYVLRLSRDPDGSTKVAVQDSFAKEAASPWASLPWNRR